MLDIFQKILKVREDSILLLVGDGELHQEIHKEVKKRKLESQVIFTGQVSNPELYYRLADILVIPSVFEGLSLTTIESQIAGIPAVVSEAIPDEAIISDGVVRLSLKDSDWVKEILALADKKVTLNEKSYAYDIQYAVKKLENWYEEKAAIVSPS